MSVRLYAYTCMYHSLYICTHVRTYSVGYPGRRGERDLVSLLPVSLHTPSVEARIDCSYVSGHGRGEELTAFMWILRYCGYMVIVHVWIIYIYGIYILYVKVL